MEQKDTQNIGRLRKADGEIYTIKLVRLLVFAKSLSARHEKAQIGQWDRNSIFISGPLRIHTTHPIPLSLSLPLSRPLSPFNTLSNPPADLHNLLPSHTLSLPVASLRVQMARVSYRRTLSPPRGGESMGIEESDREREGGKEEGRDETESLERD